MDTFGERVKQIIVSNGLNMTSFAQKLNISQSMVSKICSNRATPSERTIIDICRIFHISEEWLTQGTGEMFSISYDTDFAKYTKDLLSVTARLPPELQQLMAEYVEKLTNISLQNPDNLGSYFDGYLAGHRDGCEMQKKVHEYIESSRKG